MEMLPENFDLWLFTGFLRCRKHEGKHGTGLLMSMAARKLMVCVSEGSALSMLYTNIRLRLSISRN